ncbi:hypothetical protein [Achromobacter xylosoxidans]|uniref:Uncharacterized protein n=1 Tax=Alcaligenes xylosoxydans xylosoxydans TaxID=85698 RepID=A0A1R1JK49_ALCXX|nr:hypothetical protein [Achromobacter xylosoxidans]OMG75569.1 hypothetical protein BIZ92_18575 [Achromobacter xylosoxidans]BEG74142.1 hypothetical protein HBIAX_01189 [Achromobacter xylosoxidans]
MTEKSKTWRSTTTTRSWSMSGGAASGQDDVLQALRNAGGENRVNVSEQWSYEGGDGDDAFKVEIKDGAVTVNGRRYDNLDEVPRAERERIEALRKQLADGGLWNALRDAGLDIGGLSGLDTQTASAKPEFIMETDIPDVRSAVPASAPAAPDPRAKDTPAPGAVPRAGGGLRRIVLVAVAVGLAWWILRLTGAA